MVKLRHGKFDLRKKGRNLRGHLLQGFEILWVFISKFDSFPCIIKCLYQTKSNMGVYIKNINILLSN